MLFRTRVRLPPSPPIYMKHVLQCVIAAFIFAAFAVVAGSAFAARSASAVYDGDVVKGCKIYDFSGEEYFPLSQLARIYKTQIVWHPVTGKVSLMANNRRMDIFLKSTRYTVDGKRKRMSAPVRTSGKEALVPASFATSVDFNNLAQTSSSWNPEAAILTVEKKINVLSPRFYSRPDKTEIILEQQQELSYECNERKPGQIVISFLRGRVARETVGIDDGVVREIEAKNDGRRALVTIYLTAGAGRPEKKVLSNPPRLVIDIPRTGLAAEKSDEIAVVPDTSTVNPVNEVAEAVIAPEIKKESPPAPAPAPVVPAAVPVAAPPKPAAQPAKERRLVVLDAGHGGEDPGATGRNGTKEKDINLAIVLELERLFKDAGEFDTILTRTDDKFVPLVERSSLANEKRADIFVSVHCNASMDKNSGGFEIYFLSEKASDDEAAATAILENSVIRLEGKPSRKQSAVQELLWSMAVNEFINEASELCSHIATEVMRRIKIQNRGVKQAGFYVLRGTQMPAVLVECAFMSHIGEEAKLKSRRFQHQVADSVYEGVRGYLLRKGKSSVVKK